MNTMESFVMTYNGSESKTINCSPMGFHNEEIWTIFENKNRTGTLKWLPMLVYKKDLYLCFTEMLIISH